MIKQNPIPLGERVAHLEEEVIRLKSRLPVDDGELGWLSAFEGRFENAPLFDLSRPWNWADSGEKLRLTSQVTDVSARH